MANGTDSSNVASPKVRPRLKREFEFAFRSHSEISGSLGRTRSRRAQPEIGSPPNGSVRGSNAKQKVKSNGGKETVESERGMPDEFLQGDSAATSDDMEQRTNGSMANSMVKGVLEENNNLGNAANEPTFSVLGSCEGSEMKDVVDGVAYEEGNRSLSSMDGVEKGKCVLETATNTGKEFEEGSLKSPASVINGGVGLEAKPILVKGSKSKVGERSVRRFTRSLLKENAEESLGVGSASSADSSKSMKHSKADASKKFPSNLKDLLVSGVLEGVKVKYLRGVKTRGTGEAVLQGVIKGSGIQCFCHLCKGKQAVTPASFEVHAGSANKRPLEYICLENGNTLRDVMNACKDASLNTLDESMRVSIGPSLKKSSFCLNCRGPAAAVIFGKSLVLCSQCIEQAGVQVTADSDKGSPDPVPETSFSTAIVPKSSKSKSQGRVTRKDLRMHKLVFEDDVLPDGTEVAYYVRGKKMLVGYKKGSGIFCSCCNSEVSPSQFEAHAGWASRRKPYLHIYTSNGVSLHELALSLSKNRKFSTQENDDLCQICRDGGSLLCCDACPRSYHRECVSLPKVPSGKWYCKFCLNNFQKEKFVERNANAIAAGRVAGVDPIEQITRRCIRIVKTLDADFGGCAFCRGHDFAKEFGPKTVILCDQCEREYHVGCLKEHNKQDLKELPEGKWFCCTECNRVHSALQKLVVRGEERLLDSCVTAIRGKCVEAALDVRWRLLNVKIETSADTKALLSQALSILRERFDPIVAAGPSGKDGKDMITAMVYGDNLKGQEFSGMYCAVLLVNQVVVSCAIIRFFGQELAELPLVATTSKAEGKGYFQALFTCLEKLLGFLDIRYLVLPAAEEAESIWKNKFGFTKLTHDEVMKFRKSFQMMVFQGTSMLQKFVPKCRVVGG